MMDAAKLYSPTAGSVAYFLALCKEIAKIGPDDFTPCIYTGVINAHTT
jgi:hypothetical protein